MKKVIIIHGWESNPQDHWYQEEKDTLEKFGYNVYIPRMPGDSFVKEGEWVKTIKSLKPNENDILIGHSLGAPAILRYLEETDNKISSVFLIAGFSSPLHLDYPNAEFPEEFVNHPFNWDKIKQNSKEFYVISQKSDPWVELEKGSELANNLSVKLRAFDGEDHFDKMDLNIINNILINK